MEQPCKQWLRKLTLQISVYVICVCAYKKICHHRTLPLTNIFTLFYPFPAPRRRWRAHSDLLIVSSSLHCGTNAHFSPMRSVLAEPRQISYFQRHFCCLVSHLSVLLTFQRSSLPTSSAFFQTLINISQSCPLLSVPLLLLQITPIPFRSILRCVVSLLSPLFPHRMFVPGECSGLFSSQKAVSFWSW